MNNAATLAQVLAFIDACSVDDMKIIRTALSQRVDDANYAAKQELKVGDVVEFKPRKRGYPPVIRGTVFAKLVKNVEVRPIDGSRPWIISPALLTKVEPG